MIDRARDRVVAVPAAPEAATDENELVMPMNVEDVVEIRDAGDRDRREAGDRGHRDRAGRGRVVFAPMNASTLVADDVDRDGRAHRAAGAERAGDREVLQAHRHRRVRAEDTGRGDRAVRADLRLDVELDVVDADDAATLVSDLPPAAARPQTTTSLRWPAGVIASTVTPAPVTFALSPIVPLLVTFT